MSILNSDFNQLDKDSKILLKAELFKNKTRFMEVVIKLEQSTEEKPIYDTVTVEFDRLIIPGTDTHCYKVWNLGPSTLYIDRNMIMSSRIISFEQANLEFGNSIPYNSNGKYEVFRIMVYMSISDNFVYLDLLPEVSDYTGNLENVSTFLLNIADQDEELNDIVSSGFIYEDYEHIKQ